MSRYDRNMNNNTKQMTQDEFVAALFASSTYYGNTILQVETHPATPGFVGHVFVTVADPKTSDGTRTTYTTFGPNLATYIDLNAFGA